MLLTSIQENPEPYNSKNIIVEPQKKEAEAQKFCRKKKDPIQDAISDPENFHRFQSKVEKMLG